MQLATPWDQGLTFYENLCHAAVSVTEHRTLPPQRAAKMWRKFIFDVREGPGALKHDVKRIGRPQ